MHPINAPIHTKVESKSHQCIIVIVITIAKFALYISFTTSPPARHELKRSHALKRSHVSNALTLKRSQARSSLLQPLINNQLENNLTPLPLRMLHTNLNPALSPARLLLLSAPTIIQQLNIFATNNLSQAAINRVPHLHIGAVCID